MQEKVFRVIYSQTAMVPTNNNQTKTNMETLTKLKPLEKAPYRYIITPEIIEQVKQHREFGVKEKSIIEQLGIETHTFLKIFGPRKTTK